MSGQDIITVLLAVAALVYVILRVRRIMIGRSDCGCARGMLCACKPSSTPNRPTGVPYVPLIPLGLGKGEKVSGRNGTAVANHCHVMHLRCPSATRN